MEAASTLGLSRRELQDINLVRIFLGVTTVSHIANAIGTHVVSCIWHGVPIPDRRSRQTFPRHQEQPTPYQLGLWRRLLRSLIVSGARATSSDHYRLGVLLGSWIAESNMTWDSMLWDACLYWHNPFHDSGECNVAVHSQASWLHGFL